MMILAVLLGQTREYLPRPGIWSNVLCWLPLLICLAFYVLLIVCIYRAAKYLGSAGREQKLLRIEMGKLADEVHLLRQELKENEGRDSSAQPK
jgi:hypothetical protein